MSETESPQQWAHRVLTEHGPPPPGVLDAIAAARARTEEKQRTHTA